MLQFEIFIELLCNSNEAIGPRSRQTLLPLHLAAGIRTPPQSNVPITGNALKTSFQHLELMIHVSSWYVLGLSCVGIHRGYMTQMTGE